MIVAASAGSTCSQILTTHQPSDRSAVFEILSRATFCFNFGIQYSLLDFGIVPCRGHECQKQPSMKTAILCFVNTMSG